MHTFLSLPPTLFVSHTDPHDISDNEAHRAERLQPAADSLADRRITDRRIRKRIPTPSRDTWEHTMWMLWMKG